MKRKIEHTLTIILLMLLIPCAVTMLLKGKMESVYRKIQDEAAYISVKTQRGIQEMNMEEYIIGITAAQIPLDYELEAIKAQMVIARTNLLYQQRETEIWGGEYLTLTELEMAGAADKFLKAQRQTKGQILSVDGEPVLASFHALSAGKTRDGKEVLGEDGYQYLKSKSCPADQKAAEYQQRIQIAENWTGLEIVKKDSAGYVQQLMLDDTMISGEEFRKLLGLPSSNFEIEEREDGLFLLTKGIGHGLGMSQYTAQQLAMAGKSYQDILYYFFDGVEIKD